jgi:selenide,water dikinase
LEAGVLCRWHSIVDTDVKYGLSVMGTVHPDKIFKNDSPEPGDVLILTKPLGVGIVCTAERVGECSQDAVDMAVKSMTTLNKYAMEVLKKYDVHACTDVTGFGLLGHLKEMLGEKFGAEIYTSDFPVIEEALEYADEFYITAAAQKNRNHCEGRVVYLRCFLCF